MVPQICLLSATPWKIDRGNDPLPIGSNAFPCACECQNVLAQLDLEPQVQLESYRLIAAHGCAPSRSVLWWLDGPSPIFFSTRWDLDMRVLGPFSITMERCRAVVVSDIETLDRTVFVLRESFSFRLAMRAKAKCRC